MSRRALLRWRLVLGPPPTGQAPAGGLWADADAALAGDARAMTEPMAAQRSPEWEDARKRVVARWEFRSHLVVYVVVNAFLVMIWAITGAGYFWPVWILGGWGIGLVLHAWDAFFHRPVTDRDIEAELHRTHR